MASVGDDTAFNDVAYGREGDALYASIRRAAFGEDIGQNPWLTADELRERPPTAAGTLCVCSRPVYENVVTLAPADAGHKKPATGTTASNPTARPRAIKGPIRPFATHAKTSLPPYL